MVPKITGTGSGKGCCQMLMVFCIEIQWKGGNPQGLKGGWVERESCCTASFLGACGKGNGTFSCNCGLELLAERCVLGLLAAGG